MNTPLVAEAATHLLPDADALSVLRASVSGMPTSEPAAPAGPLWRPCDLADPYPRLAAWREAGPLHWCPELFGGAWVVTRHAEAEQVLRGNGHFSAQRTGGWVQGGGAAAVPASGAAPSGELALLQGLMARALLFVDAPDHGRLRRLMQAGFTPSGLAAARPWVADRIEQLLDALQGQALAHPGEPVDFIATVARPLPACVIAHVLGLPPGDEHEVMAWSEDIAAFIGATEGSRPLSRQAQRGLRRMATYFQRELQRRGEPPGPGLLGTLRQARAGGTLRDDAELLAQATMLLFAGHETTRHLLGNAVLMLLQAPGAWAALQPDGVEEASPEDGHLATLPAGPWHAVREVLRFEPPVQYTGRRVAVTHRFCGQTLRRGQAVVVLIAAANRDPARYAEPDRFNPAPRRQASLAFGSGAHVCVGAALTQMEATLCLAALRRRWPDLRLADPDRTPAWWGNALYRGLRHLPLTLPPAGG